MKCCSRLSNRSRAWLSSVHSANYRQSGLAYVEYVVTTLGVVLVLFAPVPGQGGEALFDLVMEAIRNFGQQSTLLLSLP